MAGLLANHPRISDLRGSVAVARGVAVLEDPSGRRRRVLRVLARGVAIVLTLWLVALVLGAAGLSPVPGIPFTHALRPAAPPPALDRMRAPAAPASTHRRARSTPAATSERAAARVAPRHAAQLPATVAPRLNGPAFHRMPTTTKPAIAHTPAPTAAPNASTAPAPASRRPTWAGSGGTTTTTSGTTTTPTTGGRSGSAPGRSGITPGQLRGSGTAAALAH
jgi:hypothetical protein